MQYKTIMLELLQQRPQMHEELRQSRKLLETVERFANELRDSHLALAETLSQARPDSEPSQIKSEALEIALQEMEERLDAKASTDTEEGGEGPTLDGAMAYIRRHTPSA
jgi:hypothetical protein